MGCGFARNQPKSSQAEVPNGALPKRARADDIESWRAYTVRPQGREKLEASARSPGQNAPERAHLEGKRSDHAAARPPTRSESPAPGSDHLGAPESAPVRELGAHSP